MLFGILLLIGLYIIYKLLLTSILWKLALALFAWLGMYALLQSYGATNIALTVSSYNFTWAQIIPTVFIIIGMMHIKET